MQWRLLVCCLLMLVGNVNAKIENNKPEIIIILDDLGYRPTDIAAFSLPTEVTFAILPQTPLASTIAERAHAEGRNVMLHMPIQASNGKKMGPLGLTTNMYPAAITHTLRRALKSVPYAVGVNNHMGSAFTGEKDAMMTIMEEIKRQGLFFVDSRTSVYTRGEEVAQALGVPSVSRHVFLDHQRTPSFLTQQFERTKTLAKKRGSVVVIAHPYPETLAFLAEALPHLSDEGLQLVSITEHLKPHQPLRHVAMAQHAKE